MQRHFFHPSIPFPSVIFATATVLAFVLLRDSRFNFHCYTQCEATPTQKSARKCAATSRDFLRERLQSAFTLANQLRWIAQYTTTSVSVCCLYTTTSVSVCCLYTAASVSLYALCKRLRLCVYAVCSLVRHWTPVDHSQTGKKSPVTNPQTHSDLADCEVPQ